MVSFPFITARKMRSTDSVFWRSGKTSEMLSRRVSASVMKPCRSLLLLGTFVATQSPSSSDATTWPTLAFLSCAFDCTHRLNASPRGCAQQRKVK